MCAFISVRNPWNRLTNTNLNDGPGSGVGSGTAALCGTKCVPLFALRNEFVLGGRRTAQVLWLQRDPPHRGGVVLRLLCEVHLPGRDPSPM